jgi:uncharacterized protein YcaQ
MPRRISRDAARRMALAAQGFARPRPTGRITRQHLRRLFDDVGLIQVDSVNVLVRSQELPLFSRLGPHPRTLLAEAADAGETFEYWAHACSLLPATDHWLWRWRMALNLDSDGWDGIGKKRELLDNVLEQVRTRGPLTVGDFEGRVRTPGTWWSWDDTKVAVEHLFSTGRVTARRRPRDFARLYDVPERILPASVLEAPGASEEEARRELVMRAARSLGVATLGDLADYHHQRATRLAPIVADLVAAGRLVEVEVDGWGKPAFLHPEAQTPRSIRGRALLSPFDSLIWTRERVERLFDFNYRLEIYTPAPKRVYGYYVLPFLLDGHLVGRVDLKADRGNGVLRVQAAHVEADLDTPMDRPDIAGALLGELTDMARWLGLATVGAAARGNLAKDLVIAGADALQ